jgi:nucleoside-diphosphate kinase
LDDNSRLTLLVIKPDAVRRRLIGEVIRRVEADGFTVRDVCFTRLDGDKARAFYAVHQGKEFLDGLVEFMTSGPVLALLLERENALARLRELIGATNPQQAAAGTIRAEFGTSVRENVVHASNPEEDPRKEILCFFPQAFCHT